MGRTIVMKKLLAIIGLVSIALAAWPAWADGTPVQRLGTGVATAIAVSPDGATLAVGTSIGVWFLSAASLAPLNFWDAGQWVQSVAYSVDGHYLRAGDQYYDTATGTAALLAPADLTWLPRDCSPGGQRCLMLNLDNLIIRDQDTRIDSALLRTGLLFDAAWSPDGNTIYTVVYGGVQAWDAASGKLRQSQTDFFTGSLYGVHWSADGTRIASGNHAWVIATGQPTEGLACGSANAPADCAVPDYDIWGGTYMMVYDQHSALSWRTIIPHDAWITALAFSLDGSYLATSGSDHYQYKCPAGVAESTDGGQCQTQVGSTRIWDPKSFKLLDQLPVQFAAVAIAAQGAIVVGQTHNTLQAWDWATGRQLWSVPGEFGYGGDIALSPTGNIVASYSTWDSRAVITLWRLATGEHVGTLSGHTAPNPWPSGRLGNAYGVLWYQRVNISGVAFSPDGQHLAASGLDGSVLVWPVP